MTQGSYKNAAKAYITKVNAAERLVNSTIRLMLLDEDALSIHSLGACAHRTLRDIKAHRGGRHGYEPIRRGLFYIARDLATTQITKIPDEILLSADCVAIVEAMRDGIARGEYR